MNNSQFAHLHLHTDYSQLDGAGKIKEYVKQVKNLGFTSLGISDHGNIDGVIKFQKECIKNKIIPIIGCEAYIVSDAKVKEKNEKKKHITLLVKNNKGWQNLCQLLTYANIEGFYYKPRIDYEAFLDHCEGLIVMSGCAGTFLTDAEEGESFFFELYEKIKDDLYIEVMPYDIEVQHTVNKFLVDLHEETAIKMVATNDCHYVYEEDWEAQEVLLAIQRSKKWTDKDRWKFGFTGLHLRTANEMIEAFKEQNILSRKQYLEAIMNTLEIVDKCKDFKIEKRDITLPDIPTIKGKNYNNYLFKVCDDIGYKLIEDWDINYADRFLEEFNLIKKKKFAKYFLLVHELVNWCKENDIGIGSRGSVAGSLIAYLLGITDIDPIRFDLLFWRFISEERIDYPDIDCDFEHIRREEVKQHLRDLYGENNIASISNFLTMKGKMAVKDVARVFAVPVPVVNRFTSVIDDDKTNNNLIGDALSTSEGKEFNKKYPKVVEIAMKLEGQVRGYGQHAGGMVISEENLIGSDRCNLIQKKKNGQEFVSVNWDMEDSEYMGLIKLDILGLREITILNETRRAIESKTNEKIIFEKLNLNDKDVLKEFALGNNVGIFQFNSYGMVDLCKKLKINSFDMLVHANALYRPGTLRSGMVDELIKRKNGKKWESVHPAIEEITKNTFGVIVYQEQVMQIANSVAGLLWRDADKIRKVIGKSKGKAELEKYEERFIDGCIKSGGLKEKVAIELWNQINEFGGYAFNKSHSVAYSANGYRCAWFKKYYPTEFMSAALTYGAEDKKPELIKEAHRLGLNIVLPKIGRSDAIKWTAGEGNLYCPFIEVKGIGEKKAMKIVNEPRQETKIQKVSCRGFFIGKERRVEKKKISQIDNILEEIGAFDKDSDEIRETADQYFSFDIGNRPELLYPNLYKIFKDDFFNFEIEDMLSGKIGLNRVIKEKRFRNEQLLKCKACELINECKKPVLPSCGINNIIICGEGPGYEENEEGEGFIGRAGKLLWEEVAKYKYDRLDFHISNVVKCFVDPNIEIFTSKGIKKICNIKIGDRVLTHKGKFKKVNWIRPNDILPRRSELIRIKYEYLGGSLYKGIRTKIITVTPEHPFMINNEWIEARNIKAGDNIKVLAKSCKGCEVLIPYFSKRSYCSNSCGTIHKNKTRKWSKKQRKVVSKRLKQFYKIGVLDRKSITKNANKRTRKKIKGGTFHLLTGNRTFSNPFKGETKYTNKDLAARTKKSYETNLKSGHLKRLSEMGKKALLKYYKTHKREMPLKRRNTKIEQIMVWGLKKRKIKFSQNENLLGLFPDILLENYKIIIECDGSYWHSTKKQKERDRKRDEFLESNGYTVLRFSDIEIENNVFNCIDEVEKILNNHNDQYNFMDVKIISVRKMTETMEHKLYNFGVWGDSSYIANGLVSHNCYPSESKTPTKQQIETCSVWLEEEVKKLKSRIILSLGNSPRYFFTGEESGITSVNGSIEWNEKVSAWVCYCVHPAWVIRNKKENIKKFREGLKLFFNLIERMGG